MNPETDYRTRLFIAGELVDEAWIDTSATNADAMTRMASERQSSLVAKADEEGRLWLLELYDPGLPEVNAYQRFGTDALGMVKPSEAMLSQDALGLVTKRYRESYDPHD